MNGPYFDLETIWDEHTYFEFENRSVEWTMSTMVQEPYVNHIPTVSPFPHPGMFIQAAKCEGRLSDRKVDDGRSWA